MSGAADQQAFTELRMKQIELQKQLVQVSSQQGIKERQKRKGELTKSELAELPAETKLYRAVGKTFILSNKPVIDVMLDKEVTDCAAEAESLSKQREYLERALDDAENNLQEFLKQK